MNTNSKSPVNGKASSATGPADLWITDDNFITDGTYKCLVTIGRYSINIFVNPSGKLTPRLSGYRPQESAKEAVASGGTGEAVKVSSKSRRVRENNFDSLKEADARRDELILDDSGSEDHTRLLRTSLTPSQLRDAEAAVAIMRTISPFDRDSIPWTFTRTATYTANTFKPCENQKPLEDAVEAYLIMKDVDANRATTTIEGMRGALRNLVAACPEKQTHEVTSEDIMPLMYRGETVATIKRRRSLYLDFFKWCMKVPRKWVVENPVLPIPLPDREDDQRVPEILPNEDVQKLLAEALKFKGGRLFLFCLCAICCALRPSEIARIQALKKVLGKTSFHFGTNPSENYIDVIGKKRRRRTVIIPPEFVPFVRAFVEAGYPVLPRNFIQDWTHLRALAGYRGSKGRLPSGIVAEKLKPWAHDVCRHTGGTHHLGRYENEWKTALWMGNSPKMIFTHYKGRTTEHQPKEFFVIASKLRLPTAEELVESGIPEGATDALLAKFGCPATRHTTFAMKKTDFQAARSAYLELHPEAAIPERRGFTRGKGMWTKSRMLDLPTERNAQIHLIWTRKVTELALELKAARSTVAKAIEAFELPPLCYPPKGYWQRRAAGKFIPLPAEVAAVFPNGLPLYRSPVGREIKLKWPKIDEFFRMMWEMKSLDIAVTLKRSQSSVERHIRSLGLPRPEPEYWLAEPAKRVIPENVKQKLAISAAELQAMVMKHQSENT